MSMLDNLVIATGAVGSLLIAVNFGHNVLGYWSFLISSSGTLWLLYKCNSSYGLKVITIFYILMDIIGIIRY